MHLWSTTWPTYKLGQNKLTRQLRSGSAWVGTVLTFGLLSDKYAASNRFTRRCGFPRSLWVMAQHSAVPCHGSCLRRHGCLVVSLGELTDTAEPAEREDASATRRPGNEAQIRCDWAETGFLCRNTLDPFPKACHHVVGQLTGWNCGQCLTL